MGWDEGDVVHNEGSLFVGGDPFMSGTSMYLDQLRIRSRSIAEEDVLIEAGSAFSPISPKLMRLGCNRCTAEELLQACGDFDDFHPCLCQELMGFGLNIARAMGWL